MVFVSSISSLISTSSGTAFVANFLTFLLTDYTSAEPAKETLYDAEMAVGLGYGESKWVT